MKKFKVIQTTVASLMAVSMIGLSACDLLFGDNPVGDGNTYDVVLNANEGDILRDLPSYVSGEETPLPAATRNHYIFDGWYADEDFSGSAVLNIPKTSIGDVEYWAKWTPETYNVTYMIDGEEYVADGYDTYTYDTASSLPTVSKDNYSLNGWYESADCAGNPVTSIVEGEYGDKTYYATWSPNTYNVNLVLNGGSLASGVVFNGYAYGIEETLPANPTRTDYKFDGWYEKADFSGEPVTVIPVGASGDKTYYAKWTLTAAIEILSCGGYEEGAYVEINPSELVNLSNIRVYYKSLDDMGAYIEIDSELIREIERKDGTTYIRADIVGISAGAYSLKVSADGSEVFRDVNVTSYDRSGYAHFGTNEGVGAYNNDGTPKSGAVIVYVNEETKNTVQATIGSKTYTGLSKILAAATTGTPVIVRIIGKISAPTWAHDGDNQMIEYTMAGSELTYEEAQQQTLTKFGVNLANTSYSQSELVGLGFKLEEGIAPLDGLTSTMTLGSDTCWNNMSIGGSSSHPQNITVEGIGTDAEIFQWGFTWRYAKSIEIRNITFDDYTEDACSFEGGNNFTNIDSADSQRIWVHNNTFNEGKNYWDASDDQDKHEGDGATDFKRASYITISYNHYYLNHKTGLIGADNSSTTANVTFHHNYYDTCKSRLPLARQANMHMYNNYYHNSSSTSISLRSYAYAFIEYCYFDGSNNTMIDIQGYNSTTSESYGVAKLYNCEMDGKGYSYSAMPEKPSSTVTTAIDTFIKFVDNRYDLVENFNKFSKDFDTNPSIFYYDSVKKCSAVTDLITDVNQIPTLIPQLAGVHKN